MEGALKEVFGVHRNVVRGLRMQLHQVTQERDELKQKLGQSNEQLEKAVSKLKEETCFLHSVIKQFRCQGACGFQSVRSSEHASSPISPSNKHRETTHILEERLHILVQTLSTVSQQLKETCSHEKASQDGRKLLVSAGDREQNQGPDQSQDSMRASTQSSQQNQPRKSSQAARMMTDKLFEKAEKVLSENKVNLNGLKSRDSEDIKSSGLQKPDQQKKAAQKETDRLLVGAASFEELSDNVAVTLTRHANCRKEVENQTGASQKSPEQGSKLQLLRHAAKRRRYTEDDGMRKRRRLYTNKSTTGSKEDMFPPLEVQLPGDRPLNNHTTTVTASHSQFAERQNKTSHQCGIADGGGKTLPVPQTRQTKDVCHAEDETHQDTDSSSVFSDHGVDDGTAVDSDSPVCGVPETLGMDLFEEMETEEKRTAPSSADGEIENRQDKKQKTSSSSARSKAKVRVICGGDGRSGEKCEKTEHKTESGEGGSSQGIWPTDSVVFGSALPRLAQRVVPEAVSTSSLYIDEGHKEADRLSPVFLTHCNEPHANISPALFDEADSDTDSEECISSPPVVILTRSTIHNPDKQCAAVEKPAVSPVSPNLLQPSQHTGFITHDDFSLSTSKPQTSSRCVLEAGKRRVSMSQTLQTAKDAINSTVSACPQHPENSPAHGTQTNMTQSTAWNPAPRRKLFKMKAAPALPSADDTINPCLLDGTMGDTGDHKAIADPQSSQGDQAALCSQLNASLDPAVRLTQYLQEPTVNTQTVGGNDEMCELPEDQEDVAEDGDVTLDPRFQRLHQTSGQDVTIISLSGTSQTYTDCQLSAPPAEEERPTTGLASLEDSFDRVPQKKAQSSYAFTEVVRKQAERKKLKAFVCWDCEKYYSAMGLAEGEVRQRMAQCSRHRARQAPPSTPEHFWSIGFPDTPECEERQRVSSEKNRCV